MKMNFKHIYQKIVKVLRNDVKKEVKKLKDLRDILAGIWGISIVARIVSKLTSLYEMPIWTGVLTAGIILIVIILSLYIHFKEYRNEKDS